MTLQQAHELQRRKLISLRAKVARLEKQTTGLFPVEEKETLERHIRHLEQVNKTENRRHQQARAHWKLIESQKYDLELELLDVRVQLEATLSENELLRQRAETAEAEVAMLNGTNAKLQKKLNTNFEGTIIHDHDKTYYTYGSSHQECLAHVLRYLVGAIESEPNLKWHNQMHGLLQKIIHTAKHNKSGIPNDKIKSLTDKYDAILATASEEYEKHLPAKDFMDGFNLYKRLRDYKDDHLYFLSHPEVNYTNNISERQLRIFKRKQKQAIVLRSDAGGQHICDALTIIETAQMQNCNVYDVLLKLHLQNKQKGTAKFVKYLQTIYCTLYSYWIWLITEQ